MSTYKNTSKNKELLDEVRDVMRLHHYSIHTERTYCDWIKRYIRHNSMISRQDLIEGEAKIEAFLTHLAVDKNVAPSTQNQAMNALVFLYKHIPAQYPLQRGTDIRTIQALLGHKDIATTMIYTHVLQQGGQGVPSPLDDLDI